MKTHFINFLSFSKSEFRIPNFLCASLFLCASVFNFLASPLLLISLASCNTLKTSTTSWQTFTARDDSITLERQFLYRAMVPDGWVRKDPPKDESIADTMKPIVEFTIAREIRLTVHTFPISDKRIPPRAQIARWQRQFEHLDPQYSTISVQSHDGFAGLFLEAEGLLQGKETMMLGWSMLLAKEYDNLLLRADLKRADYTIKAIGPTDLILHHKKEIVHFANSFELIDELTAPL